MNTLTWLKARLTALVQGPGSEPPSLAAVLRAVDDYLLDEPDPDQLMPMVASAALELAAARRARLLLREDGELRAVAEAERVGDDVVMRQPDDTVPAGDEPALYLALWRHDEPVGLIWLEPGPDSRDPRRVEQLAQFAQLAGGVVANARRVRLLQAQADYFSAIVNTAREGIWLLDENGRTTFVNASLADMLGYRAEEMLGKPAFDFLAPDAAERVRAALTAHNDGESGRAELLCRHRSGRELWVTLALSPIVGADGRSRGFLAMVSDITQRKLAEQALARSEAKYRELVENSGDLSWSLDLDGHSTFVSSAAEEILGYTPAEMLGRHFREFQQPEHAADTIKEFERVRAGNMRFRFIAFFRHKQGHEVVLRFNAVPQYDRDGKIVGVTGVASDITEYHRAERALRSSEEKYRKLVETSGDIIWALDAEGRITFVNQATKELLGYRPEQCIGRTFTDFQPPDYAERGRLSLRLLHSGKPRYRHETVYLHRDGSERIFSVNSVGEFDAQGNMIGAMGISTDITELKRAEDALRESEQQLRLVTEQLPAALWTTDRNMVVTSSRGTVLAAIGLSADDVIGRRLDRIRGVKGPDDPVIQLSRRVLEGYPGGALEDTRVDRLFQTHVLPLRDPRGVVIGTLGIAFDVTELRRSQQALQRERENAQVTLDAIGDGVIRTDARGVVTYLNAAAAHLCGRGGDQALGRPLDQVLTLFADGGQPLENPARLALRLGQHVSLPMESMLQRPDGSTVSIESSATPVRDTAGEIIGAVVVCRDVSATRALAEQLSHQATHDPLTGLPNRALLLDRIAQAIAHAERHGGRLALLYLDLDRFKHINDTLGHPVGDQLLKQVAQRLQSQVRRTDTVCRPGGDEFALLLAEIERPEQLSDMAAEAVRKIAMPYHIESSQLHISTSIGISVYPDDGRDPETLIKHADIAMYHAKEKGRNNYQFFIPEMNQKAVERLFLEHSLRRALEREELELHYQPQVQVSSGKIIGVEALLRWNHPNRGLIPPSRFIPVAEDSGLIVAIGQWVLYEACRQARAWLDAGLPPLRIAVNVSAAQFRHETVIGNVRGALDASGLRPDALELEVTESVIMPEAAQKAGRLGQLKDLGVRLSIDDFGTGYSSLSYLKRLPVDNLKIDQSFVRDINTDADDAAIAQAIIRMGHSLRLEIMAEGVENRATLDFLAQNQCDSVQGYYLGRPVPPGELERLLKG